MHILDVPIGRITYESVAQLVADRVAESVTHDYKAALPHPRDVGAKSRLLKSASAFANTAGGVLVFGVAAPSEGEWTIPGLEAFDEDRDVLSLNNLLRSGIEPRIPLTVPRTLEGPDGTRLLLLGIPRSLAAPHQVALAYDGGFWARDNRGNYPMTVGDLRVAFDQADAWRRDTDRLLTQRLEMIVASTVHDQIQPRQHGALVLHVLPLGRLRAVVDSSALINHWHSRAEHPDDARKWIARPNVDGWVEVTMGYEDDHRFIQIFRNGGTESYWSIKNFMLSTSSPFLFGHWIEARLAARIEQSLVWMEQAGVGAPYLIRVTLMHAQGRRLVYGPQNYHGEKAGFDRSDITIPELVIEDRPSSLATALRPLFESFWQAAGFASDPMYAADGSWRLQANYQVL